jgi:excisionase family DNA binding protein
MKTLVTQTELADFLRVSKRTIIRLTKSQRIPYVKVGNRFRYCIDHVEKALTVSKPAAKI